MKKTFKYALIGFLLSTQSFAGLPPTSVRGQSDSSDKVKFNIQAPNNQMTDLGGIKTLVETGNDNLLKNPGFEASTVDSGWTCVSMNQQSTTAGEDTPIKGKESIELKPTDATSRCYQAVTAQPADVGKWGEFHLATKILNVSTAHDWWLQILSSDGSTVEAETQIPYDGTTNAVTTVVNYSIEASQRVQITTKSDSPDQLLADDGYWGPSKNIGAVQQAKYLLLVNGSGTQTISASTEAKVTNWETPIYGADSFSSGTFTVKESGVCEITAYLSYVSVASGGGGLVRIYKGATQLNSIGNTFSDTHSTPQQTITIPCQSGDQFSVYTYLAQTATSEILSGNQQFAIKLYPSDSQQAATLRQQIDWTSSISMFLSDCPTGLVSMNGKSIGKSSGDYQGTTYLKLYRKIWQYSSTTAGDPVVISSSAGSDADSDWNAGKTITFNQGGYFIRGYGGSSPNVSGAIGAKQADAFQGHQHGVPGTAAGAAGSSVSVLNGTLSAIENTKNYVTDGSYGTPRVASETRPLNFAANFCINPQLTGPMPILLGSVSTKVGSSKVIQAGTVTCGSSSTVDDDDGGWVTAITNISSGACTITTKDVNGKSPAQVFIESNLPSSFGLAHSITGSTSTSISIGCVVTSTGAACVGPDTFNVMAVYK